MDARRERPEASRGARAAFTRGYARVAVVPTDSLGGAERVAQMLVSVWAQQAEPHVVFMSRGDRGHWEGISGRARLHFVEARRELTGALPTAALLMRLSRSLTIHDVFSTHTHVNAWLGILRRQGILKCNRLIVRESTQILERFGGLKTLQFRFLIRLGYPGADLIVCQTDEMLSSLVKHVPRAASWRAAVLPNPVEFERVVALSREPLAIDRAADQETIVSVGRLAWVKGMDVLIDAFAQVRRLRPLARLIIVGDGPERARLTQQVQALGLGGDRVLFAGHVANPHPFLAAASVVVVASRVEGFPNVLNEAMCVGRSIVTTRCSGGLEGIPGLLTCRPGDPQGLAERILEALSTPDIGRTEAMREFARRREPAVFWRAIDGLAG